MRAYFQPMSFLAITASLALVGDTRALPSQAGASSSTAYSVLSGLGDLADGLTPTVNTPALLGTEGTSNDPKVLTNGTFGPTGNGTAGEIVAISNGAVLTFSLNTTASPNGFRLNKIDSYTGWRDTGRVNQDYSVSYSTTLLPNVFVPLTTVSYVGTAPNTQVVVQDTLLGFLATSVAKVQFSFPSEENGYVGYREFDLEGVWLPEPTSIGLILCGSMGLLARRRRAAR